MVKSNIAQGKIVLITGASSGIGARTAEFLAEKGFTVLLVARRQENLRILCNSISINEGSAHYFVSDLSSESERIHLFSTLQEQNLLPDILINNAGFAWYGYFSVMPWKISKDLLAVNNEAVVHLISLFLPSMLEKGYGHIINIGSIAGKLPEQGIAMYSASKAFIDAFTTSIYRELRFSPVNISVVRAGAVKTEFFENARKLDNGGSIPAERIAVSPEAVVKAIWRLINHPKKIIYVPSYLAVSPLLEIFFARIIDHLGPLLLRKSTKNTQ